MNKKILYYALGINLVTSFLGALFFKCEPDKINCGPFAVYIPIVVSGLVIIPIAYFITKWVKRPIFFFIIIAVLELIFNSDPESIDYRIMAVGTLPALVAAIIAWYLGKEKKIQ